MVANASAIDSMWNSVADSRGPEVSEQWHREALCAETDPDAFFPEQGGSTREAKRICTLCDVRRQCLDYALANDHRYGIWGGLTPRERHRVEPGADRD